MSNLYKNTVEPLLMATSLQRPPLYMQRLLSSVPKVVVVEEVQLYSVIKLAMVLCIIIQWNLY